MGDSIVEGFGGRVLGEAQNLAAIDPGQATGSGELGQALYWTVKRLTSAVSRLS